MASSLGQPVLVQDDAEQERVARIRAGDQAAFEAMFLEYYRPLCAFVGPYVASIDEARELVQDIFLHIWQHRARWDVRGTLRNYLFGAARNRGLSHAWRARRAERWAAAVADTEDALLVRRHDGDGLARAERADLAAAIARVARRFPERQRQAYALRWGHQLTVPEIASIMGVKPKAVEALLTRASKALRRALADFV